MNLLDKDMLNKIKNIGPSIFSRLITLGLWALGISAFMIILSTTLLLPYKTIHYFDFLFDVMTIIRIEETLQLIIECLSEIAGYCLLLYTAIFLTVSIVGIILGLCMLIFFALKTLFKKVLQYISKSFFSL